MGHKALQVEHYMADPNFFHSKLAANCCVALAKAHSVVATNISDSQSMDTPNVTNGSNETPHNVDLSLPATQLLAQLLIEIPHHMAIEVQDVSTSATPSNNNTLADENKKEMFKLSTDMSLKNAEDMSLSISSLTEGKIDIDHYMNTVQQI